MVADSSGVYSEIFPVDQQTPGSDTSPFFDGQNQSGTPTTYDKTGNGIFLDPIPNYSYSNGLKVFVNREPSHFATTDTTKVLGFAHLYHEYLALKPAYLYARDKSLPNKNDLKRDYLEMQKAIQLYFGKRQKDVKGRMVSNRQNNK